MSGAASGTGGAGRFQHGADRPGPAREPAGPGVAVRIWVDMGVDGFTFIFYRDLQGLQYQLTRKLE